MTVINGSSAALSMRICPPLPSGPLSLVAAVYLPSSTQTHKSLYNRLLCVCALGFACVGGVAVKRPMTSGHGPRGAATCRADGQGDSGTGGRTSWRVGGFYAYTYTFFICWHFAIYFIFVLLETAEWQRQQQLCPVTSFSLVVVVVVAAPRPFSPELSLFLCPTGCPFVCLSVCVLLLCQRRRQRTATRVALFRSAL